MGVHTGVFVIYYLYRSRYSFVADHCLKDGHHMVDFSNLENALKFQPDYKPVTKFRSIFRMNSL